MMGYDFTEQLKPILSDQKRKLSPYQLKNLCKLRQSDKTCRYITLGPIGFVCIKRTEIRTAIDELCNKGQMTASGDNCGGLGEQLDAQGKESCPESKPEENRKDTAQTEAQD